MNRYFSEDGFKACVYYLMAVFAFILRSLFYE